MATRWRGPNAFRADPFAAPAAQPTRRQSIVLLAVLLLVAGLIAAASYLVRPERARSFDLLSGSIFLADTVAPVSVDIATGSPSVRLIDAYTQVGARPRQSTKLAVVPLNTGGGTLLLNRSSGDFNMVDATGFVIKRDGGVPLPALPKAKAVGLPANDSADPSLAYIEQVGHARSRVYLVSQTTVRAATAAGQVQPRASAVIDAPGSVDQSARASADGDLWTLTGGGPRRTITQLSLPKNSYANGATLRQVSHGTVPAPAAVGSAAADPDGQQSTVGVASADRIEIFSPDGLRRTVHYAAPPGVDRVLAVSNQTGRLAFLLHGRTGWSLVSIGMDGSNLRGPSPIADLPSAAKLAPPAASNDVLYTLDRSSGRVWQIGLDAVASTVPGAGSYPVVYRNDKPIEPAKWDDTYLIARGTRVFYDSPSHRDALVLFTDGTHRPLVIEKSAAVGINAVAGAWALSHSRNTLPPATQKKTHGPPRTPPSRVTRAPPLINNSIDCQNTALEPHIPQILPGIDVGSRSVTFSWLYPRINNQDCIPRTYQVVAHPLGTDAPTATVSATVEGQTSVTLTGLYPGSRYEITVTAVLGSQRTPSNPFSIRTSPQGPEAPTNVRVRADANGNWVLTWDSCSTAAPSCVPVNSWQIQPRLCGEHGMTGAASAVGALRTLAAPADPTTRPQPTVVYHGGAALLGRGLSFQIMGRGINNLVGTASKPTPCIYSWAPPIASALTLSASTPSETAFGTTTTANATLNLGSDPLRDVGGLGAEVTFTLTGNGTTQTNGPIMVNSSRSTVSTTFDNITPGVQYTTSASVQPAHGGSPITVTAPSLSTRSAWPNYTVNATCAPALLSCDLHVDIADVSSAGSDGELFSLTNASQVRCNNAAEQLNMTGFDPGTSTITVNLSQLDGFYGANCSVQIQLVENAPAGSPPVYGGIPSPVHAQTVDLGPPTTANVGHDDFDVQWDPQGSSSVQITYPGTQDLADLTTNWSETVTAPGGEGCGSAQQQPGSSSAVLVAVDPTCVNLYGDQSAPWTVTIEFANRSDGSMGGPFTYQLPGPPPGYQPCDPQGLTASWDAAQGHGISVTLGSDARVSGCSQWTYAVYDGSTTSPAEVCSAATANLVGPPPQNIDTTQCSTPPDDSWFVRIGWVDTAGRQQQRDVPLGAPPPS